MSSYRLSGPFQDWIIIPSGLQGKLKKEKPSPMTRFRFIYGLIGPLLASSSVALRVWA